MQRYAMDQGRAYHKMVFLHLPNSVCVGIFTLLFIEIYIQMNLLFLTPFLS